MLHIWTLDIHIAQKNCEDQENRGPLWQYTCIGMVNFIWANRDHNSFQTLEIYMYKYNKNWNLFQLDNDKKKPLNLELHY